MKINPDMVIEDYLEEHENDLVEYRIPDIKQRYMEQSLYHLNLDFIAEKEYYFLHNNWYDIQDVHESFQL